MVSIGGSGSGLYGNGGIKGKDTVENTLSISTNDFKGWLIDGKSFLLNWRYKQGRFGDWKKLIIRIDVQEDGLIFSHLNHEKPYKHFVEVTWTNCNFGGRRPWFICPCCLKRKGKLFLKNECFRCRECHNLTYISCQISGDKLTEIHRKMYKLAKELQIRNFKVYEQDRVLFKPKGMHQKTFDRLRFKLEWLHIKRLEAWLNEVKS